MLDKKEEEIISVLGASLFLKINKLLFVNSTKSGNSIKSIQDILKFVPDTECTNFLENIKKHVEGNREVLKQIDDNCKKINSIYGNNEGSALVALFVYSLGDKISNISNTIRVQNERLFNEMLKYDRCSYLEINSRYERYVKNAKVYGIPTIGENNALLWVMPEKSALDLIEKIKSIVNSEDKKRIYAKEIGLRFENVKDEPAFYHILLDIRRLKLVRSIAKRVALFLPNANVPGASEYWVPGGFTSGGIPEIIVHSCPRGKPFTIKEERINF